MSVFITPGPTNTSIGTLGRPFDRDFHFQKSRNPLRCQLFRASDKPVPNRLPAHPSFGNMCRAFLSRSSFIHNQTFRSASLWPIRGGANEEPFLSNFRALHVVARMHNNSVGTSGKPGND